MHYFPLARALKLAKQVMAAAGKKYHDLLSDVRVHDDRFFRQLLTDRIGATVIDSLELPPNTTKAAVLMINNVPHVLVDPSLPPGEQSTICAYAHETAHLILDHPKRLNFGYIGMSETMDRFDMNLQEIYATETELEANLLAMMLVVPDGFLNAVVEDSIWIPVKKLASENSYKEDWLAARVQLYRKIHGYNRSRHLLVERLSERWMTADTRKWFALELGDTNGLQAMMPEISPIAAEALAR